MLDHGAHLTCHAIPFHVKLWCIPTRFLLLNARQVRMYVEEQDDVPWDTLNVIVADVTYGGRVTDVWDKRTIASIMRLYFDPGLLDDSYRFRQARRSSARIKYQVPKFYPHSYWASTTTTDTHLERYK